MSLRALSERIRLKETNAISARLDRLYYWQRLLMPVSTCIMILVAMPFIFGSLRSMTMGGRFVIGTSIGFGFYLTNNFSVRFGHLMQLPPLPTIVVPLIVFTILGLVLKKMVH